MLTKHAQNKSNLSCQNALNSRSAMWKSQKFSPCTPLTGEGRKGRWEERGRDGTYRAWSKTKTQIRNVTFLPNPADNWPFHPKCRKSETFGAYPALPIILSQVAPLQANVQPMLMQSGESTRCTNIWGRWHPTWFFPVLMIIESVLRHYKVCAEIHLHFRIFLYSVGSIMGWWSVNCVRTAVLYDGFVHFRL
jgi:hypothetical protein